MRKNNKGFTLIEIIAVVAILGVLAVTVVPRIFSLVTESRDQMYLQDARRLISQAQYKMSSNSTQIDKPDDGECIFMSLNYLSPNDFQSPPYGGAYLTDSSFVAIKNESGTYKYAAMLIEETSDGALRGVKLSTEEELNSKYALKNITAFTRGEIRYIDEQAAQASGNDNSSILGIDYLSNLKEYGSAESWISNDFMVIGRYNYEQEVEAGTEDTSVPSFRAKLVSADNTNPESLKVNLTVNASDADSSLDSLVVCTKISRSIDDSYLTPDSGLCKKYIDRSAGGQVTDTYSESIDFETYGFSYSEQAIAYVYVSVFDPEGNSAHKKIEYYTHKNEAPKINSFKVLPADGGEYNIPNVKISADITDDMDSLSKLEVCLTQDYSSKKCNNYRSYNDIFGTSGSFNYSLKTGSNIDITIPRNSNKDKEYTNIPSPDGTSHKIRLFVKDSLGEISIAEFDYQLYQNTAPEFVKCNMITKPVEIKNNYPTSNADKNGYKVFLDVSAKDDLSNDYNLKIQIGNSSEMTINEFKNRLVNGVYEYEFDNPKYDGKNRTLDVKITDEHGLSNIQTLTLSNVYSNDFPIVEIKDIVSKEKVCTNCSGGGYDTIVKFSVIDDLVDISDYTSYGVKVCISENANDCSEGKVNTSSFSPYFGDEYDYSFSITNKDKLYSSDNPDKTLYIAVADNYGKYKIVSKQYEIYKNKAPKVKGSFTISTTEIHNYCSGDYELDAEENYKCNGSETTYAYDIPKVKIDTTNLDIEDDFNEVTGEICYYMDNDSSKEKCYDADEVDDDSIQTFLSSLSRGYTFKDNSSKKITDLKGQVISARIKVTDNYGEVGYSNYQTYKLFEDKKPEIKKVTMRSSMYNTDPEKSYNSNLVIFQFSVLDFNDTYKVCITEKDSCLDSDYIGIPSENKDFSGDFSNVNSLISYNFDYDGEKHNWNKEYIYGASESSTKKFKFFVKDSNGNVVQYGSSLNYDVYKACAVDAQVKKEKVPLYDDVGKPILYNDGSQVYEDDNDVVSLDAGGKVISVDACAGKCYHKYTDISGSTKINQYSVSYAQQISYIDKKSGSVCEKKPEGASTKYCDFMKCFLLGDGYPGATYIGLRLDLKNPDFDDIDDLGYWTYTSNVFEEEDTTEDPYCKSLVDSKSLLFCSDDTRCKANSNYCDNQGESNCLNEKSAVDDIQYTCSQFALYNPKVCVGENKTDCYEKPLRPCSSTENPNTTACLRTCSEGEIPEVNNCTPYSYYDVADLYNIPSPCPAGTPASECIVATARTCRHENDVNCIRMCGTKEIYDLDEEGNIIEESRQIVDEDPTVDNCTNNPPLTDAQIESIYNSCANPIKTTYNTCKKKYSDSCKKLLTSSTGICSIGRNESAWEEVPCGSLFEDDTESGTIVRYCENGFVNGKCLTSSDKCQRCTEDEINSPEGCDDDIKLASEGCSRVCYKPVSCISETVTQYKIFKCHGLYRMYNASFNGYELQLKYVRGTRICPEFYYYKDDKINKTGKDVEYPFKDEAGNVMFVEFNQNEQIFKD